MTRQTSRFTFFLLAALFAARCVWVPAHLVFEDHCFGGKGWQHFHHHAGARDDGHHHETPCDGEGVVADLSDLGHHHHDPSDHPHRGEVHFQDLLASRLKDSLVAPPCVQPTVLIVAPPVPERIAARHEVLPAVPSHCSGVLGARAPPAC